MRWNSALVAQRVLCICPPMPLVYRPKETASPLTWDAPRGSMWNRVGLRAGMVVVGAVLFFFILAAVSRSQRADQVRQVALMQQSLELSRRATEMERRLKANDDVLDALSQDPRLSATDTAAASARFYAARSELTGLESLCLVKANGEVRLREPAGGDLRCVEPEVGSEVERAADGSLRQRMGRALPNGDMVTAVVRLSTMETLLAPQPLSEFVAVRFALVTHARDSDEPGVRSVQSLHLGVRPLWLESSLSLPDVVGLYQPSDLQFVVRVLAVALFGSLALVWFLGGVIRPLREVAASATRMAQGELSTRTAIGGPQEVRQLGSSLNHLAAMIQRGFADLEGMRLEFAQEMHQRSEAAARALAATQNLQRLAQDAATAAAKQAEVLEEQNRSLEQTSRLKSEFLASMSHELRTPLNAVLGFSELLLEGISGSLNDEQRDAVRDIHSAGRHLLVVINDLLDLAKAESGQMTFDDAMLDLREPVSQAAEMVRSLALKKGVDFRVALDVEVMASGDVKRLRQVAINLFSNAVKFTPAGGTVSVDVRSSSEGFAEIEVRDSGIGIDPSHHELIFEAFGQVESAPGSANEGTGLGLALVRRFMQGMHGDVRVESRLGVGSRFIVHLPSVQPNPQDLAVRAKQRWGSA